MSLRPSNLEDALISKWVVPALIFAALFPRWFLARATFLNPDEALHYFLAAQPSLAAAYKASLSTAHPPLLILFLYYCRLLAHSEFLLRLPSVLAGIGFGYMIFLWLKLVSNYETSVLGLILALYSPALILLSAEIRQYAFLLLFVSASLYFLERYLAEGSLRLFLLSFSTLCLSLLTHYSSLIFAACAGLYGLLRLWRKPLRYSHFALWIAGQLSALGLITFLFVSHITELKGSGMPRAIGDTYLRGSMFDAGRDHALPFLTLATIRFFHYLFAQGAIGGVALCFFLAGIWRLLRGNLGLADGYRRHARDVGILLLSPFILNWGLVLAGIYPYGGTRHNSVLAEFALPGIALGITSWPTAARWLKPTMVLAVLALVNLFPAPTGAYIRPGNQSIRLMHSAMDFIRTSIPHDSVVVTDNGGGLLLSYYLCDRHQMLYQPTVATLVNLNCAGHRIVIPQPGAQDRVLAAGQPPDAGMFGLPSGTTVWIFEAGWITSGRKHDASAEIRRLNCASPRQFGDNILLCRITVH